MREMHRTGHQLVPMLIDDDDIIFASFEIVAALNELGAAEARVVRLLNLTPAETKAVTLLLAKVPEHSSLDEAAVAAIIEEVAIDDPDALAIIGFDVVEIDVAQATSESSIDQGPVDGGAKDDELESALSSEQHPVVREGDLFQLGLYQDLCGNCLERLSYNVLLKGSEGAVVCLPEAHSGTLGGSTRCPWLLASHNEAYQHTNQ